jgi:DeoR family fructose operon transcriptional repressor
MNKWVADSEDIRPRLPAGRKSELAAFVGEAGEVTVAALAERFGVSADTIRRDLDRLDADGVLIRTHGGAVSLSAHPRADTGVDVRSRLQTTAKEKIGALAATLVQDGSVVIFNAGTTALSVARHLQDQRGLTIATNNLRIPAEMSPQVYRDIWVFGGVVRYSAQATIGPVAFRANGQTNDVNIRCDLAVIGVGAVSVEGGYSTSNLEEAVMMADMMSRATKVVILADSSKIGRSLFAQIADLGSADVFVTDAPLPDDMMSVLTENGVQVLYPGEGS